jgi:hypothetical protein
VARATFLQFARAQWGTGARANQPSISRGAADQ